MCSAGKFSYHRTNFLKGVSGFSIFYFLPRKILARPGRTRLISQPSHTYPSASDKPQPGPGAGLPHWVPHHPLRDAGVIFPISCFRAEVCSSNSWFFSSVLFCFSSATCRAIANPLFSSRRSSISSLFLEIWAYSRDRKLKVQHSHAGVPARQGHTALTPLALTWASLS